MNARLCNFDQNIYNSDNSRFTGVGTKRIGNYEDRIVLRESREYRMEIYVTTCRAILLR